MKKSLEPEMAPDYDCRQGVRGKYVRLHAEGSNIVLLDPDVARAFPTEASVNSALRKLIGTEDVGHQT